MTLFELDLLFIVVETEVWWCDENPSNLTGRTMTSDGSIWVADNKTMGELQHGNVWRKDESGGEIDIV